MGTRRYTRSRTTGSASTWNMPTSCSASFSGFIHSRSLRGPGWGWPLSSASSNGTEEGCGRRGKSTRVRGSSSPYLDWEAQMTDLNEIEVLLVEDNPHDTEMTLEALKKYHLANRLHH